MSDNCDSSDGFEIVDIINRKENSEIRLVSEQPEERNGLSLQKGLNNSTSLSERDLAKETNLNQKNENLELSSQTSHINNDVHCKRKNAPYEIEVEREYTTKQKRHKNNPNVQNISKVIVLLSSSGDEDSEMSKSLVNTSEFMILEENVKKINNNSTKEQVNNLEKFFGESSSILDEISSPGVSEKLTQNKNNKASLFLNSNDDDDDDVKSNGIADSNSEETEDSGDNHKQNHTKGLGEKFFLSSVESSFSVEDKENIESVDLRNLENDEGTKLLDFDEPPIAETSFVFDNCTKNHSLSLKAIGTDSDAGECELSHKALLPKADAITSDWKIKQHPKYLATISLTRDDLERQLKFLHTNKVTKQKYSFANKVNKNFKKDIVLQELFLTTNMDIPLKNDDPTIFYLSNNDLMIKKKELNTLTSALANLQNSIEGLKVATFTRRLTSVFELNSCIFLPISALLENGIDTSQNLDFVDVDMVECILMLDIQKFYEIFHFKENESKKQLLERFFSANKKIALVLTNTSKFLSNLNKWENMKQLHKYNDINKNSSILKNNRKKIPEQYVSLSAVDVQLSILKIQMMYKTHISIQQIETEIQFINDWFLNYLKTILRARYKQPQEDQNTFTFMQSANTVSGYQTSFNSFLLGINGVTRNNIESISEMLGNNFNDMQKSLDKLLHIDSCQGAQKRVLELMHKFLKSENGDDIL